MAEKRNPITLAVLSGAAAGKVLRTARPKITVGAGSENDLVLPESGLSSQHFTVLVAERGWRIETPGPSQSVTVDRRWRHPDDDRPGALLYAGRSEFLLITGELDDRLIQRELGDRRGAPRSPPPLADDVERIAGSPVRAPSLDLSSLPAADITDPASPTIQIPSMRASEARVPEVRLIPEHAIDPIALASMPTIAGARLPINVQTVLDTPREDLATIHADGDEDNTLGESRAAIAEALGRGPGRALAAIVPEVLAEPESQMVPRPSLGGRTSWGGESVRPVDPRRNAWGEPRPGRGPNSAAPNPGPSAPPSSGGGFQSHTPVPPGYAGSYAPYPPPGPGPSGPAGPGPAASFGYGNAGSGFTSGFATPTPVPAGALHENWGATPQPRLPVPYTGRELTVAGLASRFGDHAFEVLRAPDGRYATSIRVFGTRLGDLARTYGYRAYMVTSAEPLTGKTTTALNLAFALAEDPKRRVALIEANFRQPRIGQILGLPENQGLLGVLEGRQQVTEAIARFSDRNLVVFPSGGRHPHPAEVLAAPRFKTLLSELAGTVDVALVDAPSVRPSADANLILPLVDAAMLVVLDNGTRAGWIDQAMDQLGRERVIGAVYNQIPPRARGPLARERKQRLKNASDA